MNKTYISFVISIFLILLNSCTTETDKNIKSRIERTKLIFNDSTKIKMFDSANYKVTILNNKSIKAKNEPLMLNFEIEIKMGFEDMELKYVQPEEFDLSLVIYDIDNNLKENIKLDFDLFDKLYFSYDGNIEKDIAILKKQIILDYDYFNIKLDKNVNENLKNKVVNFLNHDKIEMVFNYTIDDKKFTKKFNPIITLNSLNREENNFNLTPFLKNIFGTNSNSKITFEINALKISEDNSIYFPTSEKVFLNIYKVTFEDVNSIQNTNNMKGSMQNNEELIFESNKKMNFLQVVDDDIPFINTSKEYYYDWNKKDNSNNYLEKGFYRFEIGLRTNIKNDKVSYYIYYK